MPTEHGFTPTILEIITKHFGKELAEEIFGASELVRYLNEKTKSASKGSKSRGSFASLYAVFVLVEDYHSKGFQKSGKYRLCKTFQVTNRKWWFCFTSFWQVELSRVTQLCTQGKLPLSMMLDSSTPLVAHQKMFTQTILSESV